MKNSKENVTDVAKTDVTTYLKSKLKDERAHWYSGLKKSNNFAKYPKFDSYVLSWDYINTEETHLLNKELGLE
tara:strand:+ start:1378 stop:1596 length:219 start_codon:yes stop_codon:yes gene_type:complete